MFAHCSACGCTHLMRRKKVSRDKEAKWAKCERHRRMATDLNHRKI